VWNLDTGLLIAHSIRCTRIAACSPIVGIVAGDGGGRLYISRWRIPAPLTRGLGESMIVTRRNIQNDHRIGLHVDTTLKFMEQSVADLSEQQMVEQRRCAEPWDVATLATSFAVPGHGSELGVEQWLPDHWIAFDMAVHLPGPVAISGEIGNARPAADLRSSDQSLSFG